MLKKKIKITFNNLYHRNYAYYIWSKYASEYWPCNKVNVHTSHLVFQASSCSSDYSNNNLPGHYTVYPGRLIGTFLNSVCNHLPSYTASHPRRRIPQELL